MIVEALRSVGATVFLHDADQPGEPDLVIGWRGATFLQEVKNPHGRNRVDPKQEEFHRDWRGSPIKVVRSAYESLIHIGAMRPNSMSAMQ